MTVSSFPETSKGRLKVILSDDGAAMYYKRTEKNLEEKFALGSLVPKSFFSKFAILVYSDNVLHEHIAWKTSGGWGAWNDRTGYCIIPNCSDYKSAVQVLQSLGILPSDE